MAGVLHKRQVVTTEDRRQELTAAVDAEHVEDRLQVVLDRGPGDAQRLPISLVERPRATSSVTSLSLGES